MTCIGGLLNPATGSVILTASEVKEVESHIDQLNAENAKLRKLVCDIHEALHADKAGMSHNLILASMENDMRELGIEVRHV